MKRRQGPAADGPCHRFNSWELATCPERQTDRVITHEIRAMALASLFQWATLLDMTSEEAEAIHPH